MTNADIMDKLNWYQDNDPSNEEVYNLVVELTSNLIKNGVWNMQPIDFDNVVHDIAADVYTIVSSQKYKIVYWRAFVHRMMKLCYIPRQRKSMARQVFETDYDPVAKRALINTFVANDNPAESLNRAENRLLFSNIGNIVDALLNESKFAFDLGSILPLKLSIALSLRDNKTVYYPGLRADLEPYVRLFVQKITYIIVETCQTTGMRDSDIAFNSLYNSELFQALEEN